MSELGHVALYVRDLQASVRFYAELVGLKLQGHLFKGRGAMLSGGRTHHELLLIQVGKAGGSPPGKRIGLYHTGWKVGDDKASLLRASQRLTDAGFAIDAMADHGITQSLYLKDPDGNEVELYVDNPDIDWCNDTGWMDEPVKPLFFYQD